jgi:endonuclease/exonuclease/phosphatase family metal-dependent hydrolase
MPWGDFNIVRSPSERGGEARSSQAMVEFSEFIFEQGLIDIPLVGGRSSWSNCRTWYIIDRFLLSTEWEEYFPEVSQRLLPCILSDHYPLLLDCGVGRRGKGSFKFENMWLQVEGFEE